MSFVRASHYRKALTVWLTATALTLTALASGCAVPQPRGKGKYKKVYEPTTGTKYHLYLPTDYVRNDGRHPNPGMHKWPVVLTLHGLRPWDNALWQEREWEKEADNYGYIVAAPVLKTSDSIRQYPLRKEHDYVKEDNRNIMAVLDHVIATTKADPAKVMATSWSCGGYLAHYVVNRNPDRFACLAVRLSNFTHHLMDDAMTLRYRDRIPVAIFIGDSDIPFCRNESQEAVAWYHAHRFRMVRGSMIEGMSHRRIPQTAAVFFAEQLNLHPLHVAEAASSLAEIHTTDYHPTPEQIAAYLPDEPEPDSRLLLSATPRVNQAGRNQATTDSASSAPLLYVNSDPSRNQQSSQTPPVGRASQVASAQSQRSNQRQGGQRPRLGDTTGGDRLAPQTAYQDAAFRNLLLDEERNSTEGLSDKQGSPQRNAALYPRSRRLEGKPDSASTDSQRYGPTVNGTEESTSGSQEARDSRSRPVAIRLNGPAVGTSPHYIGFSVDLPVEVANRSAFLWRDNGEWMSDQPRGVRILETPGLHRFTVLVMTEDNKEYRGSTTVQVLERTPKE